MTARELTNILQDICHAGKSMEPVYVEIDGRLYPAEHIGTDDSGFGPYIQITGGRK